MLASGTHPLTSFHNDSTGSKRVVDADNKITAKSQEGMKGHVYRVGDELYGTLSANIHKYKGKEGGMYAVGEDHWGETLRGLLQALEPKNFIDGEVDWEKERARYL